MRVGWYFARSAALWFFALTALACGLLWSWLALLPSRPLALPSPWALAGPLWLLAGLLTWLRARRHGELLAAAAGGTGPTMVLPAVLIGGLLQVLFAVPPGSLPDTRAAAAPVQRSIDGDLFLVQADRGVWLRASGELTAVGRRLPAGFRPAPPNPQRYRRQVFFTRAPRAWPADPLDPWLLRLCYVVAVTVLPALLLRAERTAAWGLGLVPGCIPLLLL